jgi:hypothetical protein
VTPRTITLTAEQRDVIRAMPVYLVAVEAWLIQVDPYGVLLDPEHDAVVEMLPTAKLLLNRWEELGLSEALGSDEDEDEEGEGE